jgi:hypothetical protein
MALASWRLGGLTASAGSFLFNDIGFLATVEMARKPELSLSGAAFRNHPWWDPICEPGPSGPHAFEYYAGN